MERQIIDDVRTRIVSPPANLGTTAVQILTSSLNMVLADTFALFIRTKSFHWHMSGPQFRDYHLLLDEQSDQIFAMTDVLAERVRKIGGTTVRSIRHIAQLQRLVDSDEVISDPHEMLAQLRDDNHQLVASMRRTHELCDEHRDVASASVLETYIDEGEGRAWFLFEMTRSPATMRS